MKKYFLFACVAAALVSCSSDEFLGENQEFTQKEEGAILFKAYNGKATRADKVGKEAADLLGGKFIVEGVKASTSTTTFADASKVFDDYLVQWGANTAGTTDDNTNDWKYVGLISPTRTTAQTIKYWDYSADNYQFVAFSTGDLEMVTDAAVGGSKVKVTAIDNANYDSNAFTLTAAGAGDLAKCYYTDVTTVAKAEYGNPVTLKFKNMAAKVRVGLYEIVPGYSVKDVKFYNAVPTTLGTGTVGNATLFTSAASIPTDGSITVSYDNEGKATASVTAGSSAKASNLGFGAFPADPIGTTLSGATFSAGVPENTEKFSAVIPANAGQALNLMCDYTLVSEDGSNEEIKVYGAKAVVPATYTNWLPNYAYTYIFKISENSNGLTNPTDPTHEGLFPITFDAVVADITEAATGEQTTVTTVATPSVTTYQKGHKKGAEYAAGDIYVQVMKDGALVNDLNGTGKSYLYTLAANKTEADVVDALQMGTTLGDVTTGRNGLVLTAVSGLATDVTAIPGADGDITVVEGTTAKFTAAAGDYAFVYDFTPATAPAPSSIYSYDDTVSGLTVAPTDWATTYTNFYTTTDGVTYTPAVATYNPEAHYYKLYQNNNRSYAVKVIHVQ